MSSERPQPLHTQPEPGEEAQHSHAHVDPGAEIARLKRRLAASQEEVKELTQGKIKKPPYADIFHSACYCIQLCVGQLSLWDAPSDA